METMTIEVPQRKNYYLKDLSALGGRNESITLDFWTTEDKHYLSIDIHATSEGYYMHKDFLTHNESLRKFINKYFDFYKAISEEEFDKLLISLQKRLKEIVRKDLKDSDTAEPTYKGTTDAKIVEPTPTPKAEIKEVKIKRPEAMGLEGQIQELVFNCLESEYTNQTLSNAMIKLGIEPNRVEIVLKQPNAEPKIVGAQHNKFEQILRTINAGVNVALVGPAGSGKTMTAHKVAEALGLTFYSKSVSAQTGVHEFFGYQDANGNYVRTLFREAYEKGGLYLLDEYDAGNPNVLASMNQATANGTCAFADGMIEKHKDFKIIMAGNTWGHGATTEYVGRNPIDKATLDRFAFINFDYDEDFEYSLASNKGWCKKVQAIRKKVMDKKLKAIVSPRATFDGAKLLEAGMTENEVMEILIHKGMTKDEIKLIS